MVNCPVVYIIFNRPRHTRVTFEAIRAQRPAKLFIIADGPRPGHPTDDERCREVREIVETIDWPCEVYRNYADENLGCKRRVISGLDWVFSHVERAIILEDDCLPHSDFFMFCENLLERYENEPNVWVITGSNFQDGRRRGEASYYFSKYNLVWGWATWRREWAMNQEQMPFWPEWRCSKAWRKHTPDPIERRYWTDIFDRMYRDEIDTWDYPWIASVWYFGGLSATPNVNLVSNIGFGPDATHTTATEDQDGRSAHPLGAMAHPQKIKQDRTADQYVFDHFFGGLNQRMQNRQKMQKRILELPSRIARKLVRLTRRFFRSIITSVLG